ncbi:hypothetical protein ES288_A02G043500v1 [Gossypium darwinii]|uniref:Uncharacterized protein n=1 Tax=Gossypium darwinii TaxID=34276 RepID=A0A5D2HCC7_GOSDA|nr:hypothetical protein ES288_A02G043500v1 [Gossypium darwinii]
MANHGILGDCPCPRHERRSVLGETDPFGPPPNGVEDGAFTAHHDRREKGRPLSVRRSLPRPLAEPPGVPRPSNRRGNAGASPNSESEVSRDAWKRRRRGVWWPRHAAAEAWKGLGFLVF